MIVGCCRPAHKDVTFRCLCIRHVDAVTCVGDHIVRLLNPDRDREVHNVVVAQGFDVGVVVSVSAHSAFVMRVALFVLRRRDYCIRKGVLRHRLVGATDRASPVVTVLRAVVAAVDVIEERQNRACQRNLLLAQRIGEVLAAADAGVVGNIAVRDTGRRNCSG